MVSTQDLLGRLGFDTFELDAQKRQEMRDKRFEATRDYGSYLLELQEERPANVFEKSKETNGAKSRVKE